MFRPQHMVGVRYCRVMLPPGGSQVGIPRGMGVLVEAYCSMGLTNAVVALQHLPVSTMLSYPHTVVGVPSQYAILADKLRVYPAAGASCELTLTFVGHGERVWPADWHARYEAALAAAKERRT